MRTHRTATVVGTVSLAATLALVGCSSSPPKSSQESSTAASTASSAPSPTTSTATSTATTPAPGATVSGTDIGKKMTDAMVAAKSGKATITSTGTLPLSGQTEFVFTSPQNLDQHSTMKIGEQPIELVVKGGQVFVKGFPGTTAGAKPWGKVDPNGADPISKALASTGQQAGSPQALVQAFKDSSATLVDTANGQQHYKLTGGGANGADFYLDGQDRPVKFVADAGGTKVNVEYSSWGVPVTVTEPPADQVGTLGS